MKTKRITALTLLTCLLVGCQQADETAKDDQSTVELIQTDDSWGIALSTTDVSNTGLTLICSQNGGEITGELQTGEKYWIEEKVDGKWQELSTPEKPIWQDLSYTIKMQNLTQWDIQWSDLMGHYRKENIALVRKYRIFVVAVTMMKKLIMLSL